MKHYQAPNMEISLLDDEDIISTSPLKLHPGTGDNASSGEDSVIF